MKKIILIILLLLILFIPNSKTSKDNEEVKGVFISYLELSKYLKGKSVSEGKDNIDKMIENINNLKLNTIFLQVRIASDSIYDSKIFPTSMYIADYEGGNYFNILDYFLNKCYQKKIKVYAWVNPYRIRTTEDINSISKTNPAFKYLNTDYIQINKGIYYNPSKEEVTNLIIDGIKELLNYNIDGIIFDDYFYPNNDVDLVDYQEYLKNNDYISLEEYHLNVINNMVRRVHKECLKKNVLFGISPEGNIENNYQYNYADVKKWLSSNEYVDFIMPQVYYGFYNSSRDYISVIKEWDNLIKNDDIQLIIALAFYKVGIIDDYAKNGKFEWINNDNIIMKEIILSRNLRHYSGFSLYRYDSIFDKENYNSISLKELNNMKKVIKQFSNKNTF